MTLSMRFLPRYPSKIIGAGGIMTTRSGPDVVVTSDYGSLVRIPAVDNEATTFFKVWNQDNNSYSIMTFEDVIAAIGVVTGVMAIATYDPQGIAADAFDRTNHTGEQAISTVTGLQTALDAKASLTGAETLTNKTLTTPTLILKQSSSPAPTAEGDAQWDTDDNALVIGDGAGQKRFRPNAWEQIGDLIVLSGQSNVDWTDLSPFCHLRLTMSGTLSANAAIQARVSTDNGSNFLSGASDYSNAYSVQASTSFVGISPVSGDAFALTSASVTLGSILQFSLNVSAFNKARASGYNCENECEISSVYRTEKTYGYTNGIAARNALRVLTTAGNFASGYMMLEGLRG